MKTCPYLTQGCGKSLPCHKCRLDAIREAHVLVRFDPRGRRRELRHIYEARSHYVASPDYWGKLSA